MSRLPRWTPEQLDAEQRELYEAIVAGPRATGAALFPLTDDQGALHGPFNAMLAAPPLGRALQQVGAAIRYRSTLTDRMRELATLAVAARWDSAFERFAHEPLGRAAGLTDAEIDALRRRELPELADPAEQAALAFVLAAVTEGDVDEPTYDAAVRAVGNRAVFELTTLVGYYATLALQLRVFRVEIPGPPAG